MSALSLVVCTYCRPLQINQLLESLINQVVPPDETLIIDGSPNRETEQIVLKFAELAAMPHLHYYRVPPEHRGLTRQRNYGIARATGNVVAFLDDDTIPESDYFAAILACFERHPQAGGVGGYITNAVVWQQVAAETQPALSRFRWRNWERPEGYRWQLRKILRLVSALPPGWIPRSGHGRPVGFLPPDGRDYRVECLMGGAAAWRRGVLNQYSFSPFFDGYGLYEDMDFCIRVAQTHPLFLCTSARLQHYHAVLGRPNAFKYGTMVVRNGWYVWRQRWAQPGLGAGLRWWATTIVLAGCRLANVIGGPDRYQALTEALGRAWGMVHLLWSKPLYKG